MVEGVGRVEVGRGSIVLRIWGAEDALICSLSIDMVLFSEVLGACELSGNDVAERIGIRPVRTHTQLGLWRLGERTGRCGGLRLIRRAL